MSRQEAAIIYLDTMLGFRSAYKEFTKAAETLNEADRTLIDDEIYRRSVDASGMAANGFIFLPLN
jgi:hypothetical protein